MQTFRRLASVAVVGALFVACSGSSGEDASSDEQDIDSLHRRHHDAGLPDSGSDASRDGGSADGADGPPNRQPCTNNFGNGLSGGFGRLDGYVIAVVPPGGGACNADRHHVHVQVVAGGETYDIAVNTDSGFIAERDAPLPAGSWNEGWHTGVSLDYPADLGLHASDFTAASEAVVDQDVENALATANHISVFATPYNRGGAHLVHRQGSGHDGAVITDPLSATSHLFAFHFSNQSF